MGDMLTVQELVELSPAIDMTLRSFLFRVLARGLWDRILESTQRGMSGKFKQVTLSSYWIAGRVMFTFWDGLHQITFVTDQQKVERIGLQSSNCNATEAKAMIDAVIANWPGSDSSQRNVFHDDPNIQMV